MRRPTSTPAWQSLAQTLAVFDEKIGKARAALVAVTDLELAQPWTLKKGGEKVFTAPRGSVLRSFVLNHSVHHRAQLGALPADARRAGARDVRSDRGYP